MSLINLNSLSEAISSDIKQDLQQKASKKRLQDAEVKILEKVDEVKNRETQRGASPAKGGRWNNTYNRQYANREKGGRRSPVTLRNRKERIEQTDTVKGSKGSKLTFRDGKMAQIFYLHNEGQALGSKIRQIYPERDSEVPEEIDAAAENIVFRLLNE